MTNPAHKGHNETEMTMQTHAERAMEIARTVDRGAARRLVRQCRQGDVMLTRVGDVSEPADFQTTPEGGVQIAAGVHGEHRLICSAAAWPAPGRILLRAEGLLVHTDVPEGRHAEVILPAGEYLQEGLRELGVDEAVQEVRD